MVKIIGLNDSFTAYKTIQFVSDGHNFDFPDTGGILSLEGHAAKHAQGGSDQLSIEDITGQDIQNGSIFTWNDAQPYGIIDTSWDGEVYGGSIITADGGGSIDTRNTGSIELGFNGTRTTVSGTATANRSINLPNESGTLALTQQSGDYEITDSTKGIIMKSPNGNRWRITIDNNGSLIRTMLSILLMFLFVCGANAQVQDLVYGTNNVVIGPNNTNALSFTNPVSFSNPISFGTNSSSVRSNLGLGTAATNATSDFQPISSNLTKLSSNNASSLTNFPSNLLQTNGNASGLTNFPASLLQTNGNAFSLTNFPTFNQNTTGTASNVTGVVAITNGGTGTNTAAAARTNLGIPLVTLTNTNTANFITDLFSGNSLPSGASASNSILTANGSGGSTFVASRTITKFTTNDQVKTNWAFNAITQTNNNDSQLGSWSLDSQSVYKVEYAVGFTTLTNAGFNHGIGFSTNLMNLNFRGGFGQAPNTTITAITAATNTTNITFPFNGSTTGNTNMTIAGVVYIHTGTNANTMWYRWFPNSNSTSPCTLIQSSMISVTKMAP